MVHLQYQNECEQKVNRDDIREEKIIVRACGEHENFHDVVPNWPCDQR